MKTENIFKSKHALILLVGNMNKERKEYQHEYVDDSNEERYHELFS